MSYQDEKLVAIGQAKFKYGAIASLIKRYSPLLQLSPALQDEFAVFERSGGIASCERFEAALRRECDSIRAPQEIGIMMAGIVKYDAYRAEDKWEEFRRLQKKATLGLPMELDEIVEACNTSPSDNNLYQFEMRLREYWSRVIISDILQDQLRLISRIGARW